MGHYSMANQSQVPYEVYIKGSSTGAGGDEGDEGDEGGEG
jgi:hypothetical protein